MLLLLGTVLRPLPVMAQQPVQVTDKGILVDFQDADLRLVVAALAEAGNINVIYGDLPARRVTLRMRQPVARDAIVPLLKSLAQSNGLKVTQEPNFLRLDAAGAGGTTGRDTTKVEPAEEVQLIVYHLKNARASQLASTLQSIFGGGRGGLPNGGLRAVPLSEGLRDNYIPPAHSDSTSPAVVVELAPPGKAAIPGQLHGEVQIVPDERTNALIVRAQGSDWAIIKQAVEALDLRPQQVLIEVVIAEVRRTNESDLSVSGKIADSKTSPTVRGTLKGSSTGDFVLEILKGGGLDLNLALSALATRGEVKILSRPVVLAQNNQEARILIGSERPFIQASRSLPTDAGVRDEVIQYRDVGTKLTITPTINDEGYVNLQVLQEVSTATSEIQFGAPIISTREASTHLFVRNGQTAVLGGLIDRQQERTRSGIPILMEIPLLGSLFGSTHKSTTNSELFLFLTPHIITTDDDLDHARDGVRQSTPLLNGMLPGDSAPALAPASRP